MHARIRTAMAALALMLTPLVANCASDVQEHRVVVRQTAAVPDIAPEVDWRAHFENVDEGAILVRLDERRLSYWSPEAETYREFPIAIAELAEFEKTGATSVVRRREAPDWRPTPSMLERNPDLPTYVPAGPENPMGSHALYLGWTHYAIHGTNDPASIGRASTSGCIRLFPEHIAWLYERVELGTPVHVVREHERVLQADAVTDEALPTDSAVTLRLEAPPVTLPSEQRRAATI